MKISPEARVLYMSAVRVVTVALASAVAGAIFWYRRDNWMAVWGTMALVLVAVSSNIRLVEASPIPGLAGVVFYFMVVVGGLFIYTFPDSRIRPAWARYLFFVCTYLTTTKS